MFVADMKTDFSHKLLLTERQVTSPCKSFRNHSSVNIKVSKTYISKVVQLGEFHGKPFGLSMKTGLSFMKKVVTPSNRSVPIPLVLTEGAEEIEETH